MRSMFSVRSVRTPSVQPRRQVSREEKERDPVEVYCRLRPGEETEHNCVKVAGDTSVQLVPPASNKAFTSGKELKCSFKCE